MSHNQQPSVAPLAQTSHSPANGNDLSQQKHVLFDPEKSYDSCGVGFITTKSGQQTHDLLLKGNEALCVVPHRGGMSSEGVGDGAGVNIDLSEKFFSKITGKTLKRGDFGVANFFVKFGIIGTSTHNYRHGNGMT